MIIHRLWYCLFSWSIYYYLRLTYSTFSAGNMKWRLSIYNWFCRSNWSRSMRTIISLDIGWGLDNDGWVSIRWWKSIVIGWKMWISTIGYRWSNNISWFNDFRYKLLVINFYSTYFRELWITYLTVRANKWWFLLVIVVEIYSLISFIAKCTHCLNIFYRIWIGRY